MYISRGGVENLVGLLRVKGSEGEKKKKSERTSLQVLKYIMLKPRPITSVR